MDKCFELDRHTKHQSFHKERKGTSMKKKRSKLQWLACLLVAAMMMTVGAPASVAYAMDDDAAGETPSTDVDFIDDGPGGQYGNRSALGIVAGTGSKGYNPSIGERTIVGYVKNNANPEVALYTKSSDFHNANGSSGGQFKRIGANSHGGLAPHVHQPVRNVTPNGEIYGAVGKDVGINTFSPTQNDVKLLYEYLNNGKYQK